VRTNFKLSQSNNAREDAAKSRRCERATDECRESIAEMSWVNPSNVVWVER
jgi:selenocysteine lyase/cysteine desulfurase